MAKTMRNIVITCVLLIAIAAGASALVLTGGGTSALSLLGSANPFAGAQVAATNALIDSSGVKDRIESELHSHATQLSEATGIPIEVIDASIEDLSIHDWEAVEKPTDASETGRYSVEASGTRVDVTTYDDTSIVTIEAYGQEVTLGLPDSAQKYLYLLPMMDYLQ